MDGHFLFDHTIVIQTDLIRPVPLYTKKGGHAVPTDMPYKKGGI